MNLPFWKVQSVGNDFPLIHLGDLATPDATTSLDFRLAELAVLMSDRKFGVGGDGLLAIEMEGEALRLRMINPDGTEDFCGNGMRCAAKHAHGLGWVGTKFAIRHLDREVPTEILESGLIRTVLPPASYDPDKVPLIGRRLFNETVWAGMDSGMPLSLFGSALTTGSTHTIIPTHELPDDDTFFAISPKIENDPQFPQRTSVIWSQELEPMRIKIRIWERGAGETLGCGTGSSAAAVDYLRRKNKGGTVTVENPGGEIRVSMDSWESPISVESSAETVYTGVFCSRDLAILE
jgi:diaminopimelate epimerase